MKEIFNDYEFKNIEFDGLGNLDYKKEKKQIENFKIDFKEEKNIKKNYKKKDHEKSRKLF